MMAACWHEASTDREGTTVTGTRDSMGLSQALTTAACRTPDQPALTLGDQTLTYAQLDGAASALATSLVEEGVEPGDRVALWMPNVPHFVISYFAILRAGGVVVPVSTLLGAKEVAYILGNSGAKALIAAYVFNDITALLPAQVPTLQRVIVWGAPQLPDALDLDALCARAPAPDALRPAGGDDLAVVIYTSGTTGRPKGAMLSHRNLITNAGSCAEVIEVGPQDRFLTVLPLFHSFGATVCMILPLLQGAHNVLLPRFNPAEVVQALSAYRITVFAGVPAMYGVLLNVKELAGLDFGALRLCVTGGAPCPPQYIPAFRERFGALLAEGYGPTEASPVVSVNPPGGVQKIGTTGPPIPGVQVRIVDEEGRPLPVGEVGEVCVSGPNVMLGYWEAPEATAETIRDGWLLTGDMGRLDEDGYLSIVDRKKDMIIVSGMNVYPREVEDAIYELPEVADCAVVGEPSERRGEDVKAFVVLKEGQALSEAELLEHCRRHLASFKV
ncbi:MAG: long-chain fatty acid--CoA ligase, partial [Armatimonadetes bacterium]|nr:long-chain fatty acid--CoA ligase [Armatimonadota bacterium]